MELMISLSLLLLDKDFFMVVLDFEMLHEYRIVGTVTPDERSV